MTDATANTLIIAVPVIFASFTTMVVTILTSFRSKANGEKTDNVDKKVDIIKERVDGHATTAANENKALAKEVADLRALIAENKQIAAVLAATPVPAVGNTPAPVEVRVANPPADPVPIKPVKP